MSKKNFSSGLDDLFNDTPPLFDTITAESAVGAARETAVARKTGHSKNFVSDLDALLQEAMDEGMERFERNRTSEVTSGKSKSETATQIQAHRAPLTGLDALIRQTISVRETTPDEFGKKRLTVSVDKPKLEKLKTIARMENAFLKDILASLIDEYIQDYTGRRGIDL